MQDEPIAEPQPPDELEETKKKSEEYLNNWKRAAADMANYKKGEIERAGLLIGYAKEALFLSILPIIDSMYLAATAFGKDGFAPVEKQIQEFLKKEGIEEIKAMGEKFDPNTMESIGESESGEMELVQKGYKMGEKVLRPAKVKVSK